MRQLTFVGSFTVGEVPVPIAYQFMDALGTPINLSTYTVATFQWGYWIGGTPFTSPVTRNATITNALNGEVTYVWQGDEFATTGRHAGMFFVNNGTNQLGSLTLEWQVCSSAATPPVV